jgi:uncharacterized protein (TIGR02246 family)
MNKRGINKYWVAACACVMLCIAAAHATERLSNVGGAATDLENEKAIRKLYSGFEATWNRHDASALGGMWTFDGDHLEPDGTLAKGRKAVSELLKRQHDTVFKETNLSLSITDVWFLAREVALIDGGYKIDGIKTPDGTAVPARSGHLTAILLKERDQWWIAASRLMTPTALPYKK